MTWETFTGFLAHVPWWLWVVIVGVTFLQAVVATAVQVSAEKRLEDRIMEKVRKE